MNSTQLSKRLNIVASCVQQYANVPIRLADIGSDHAYLPCYLALNDVIEYGIAGEIVEGPYLSAVTEVNHYQLESIISVRKGDGLSVVNSSDKINTVTICGMGGTLIANILDEGKTLFNEDTTLILQPNVAEYAVREWLVMNHFAIVDEYIVHERQKFYEIIVAQYTSKDIQLTAQDYVFGPILRQHSSPEFDSKWEHELNKLQKLLNQIELNAPHETEQIQLMKQKITNIQEVLS